MNGSGGSTGWEDAERWFAPGETPPGPDAGGPPPGEPPSGDPPGEPPSAGPPEEPPAEDEGPPRCESCGSVLDDDQTYCLVCGAPTAAAPGLVRSLRSPALIGGALAILGIGAAALALVLLGGDDDDAAAAGGTTAATAPVTTPTAPDTGPLPPDTAPLPPATDSTVPTAPQTGFPTVTEEPEPEPVPEPEPAPEPVPEPEPVDPVGGTSDWPPGEVAWTAMLSSVRDEGDAVAARNRLQAQGREAGVLFSSDHPGLRPGYYVVFSGMFGSRGAAESRVSALSGEFPDAYAREIS